MKKRRNFRKRPKDNAQGLSVTVFNNNVDGALRILKKKSKKCRFNARLEKKRVLHQTIGNQKRKTKLS